MTKHSDFGRSPSIMEPVDETPSLLTDALFDAMNSDPFDMPPPASNAPQSSTPNMVPPSNNSSHPHHGAPPLVVMRTSKSLDHHHHSNGIDMPLPLQTSSSALNVDTLLCDTMSSINFHYEKSFALLDANEEMTIHTADMFVKKLGCAADSKLKVVSIFGNTGDGKSHTMNHTLFGGQEIFRTSAAQDSCTMGVWAAHQAELGVLCLDTEGLLGDTDTNNLRMRLLLKVLAVSDVIVFRTRAERLHSDMFAFLGSASRAYSLHFSAALQAMGLPGPAQQLGPAVIVFHETRNTHVVEPTHESSPEDRLRERFTAMQLNLESFSSLKYIGIQTKAPPTNYDKILNALHTEIANTTVRSPRTPGVVFKALQALNCKFSGQLSEKVVNPFPEQYFTCGEHCQSCQERCEVSMGHVAEGVPHANGRPCRYQHQFENKDDLCRRCYENGRREVVQMTVSSVHEPSWLGLARYAWSGSVIMCRNCGEIYRARQHWYGNNRPEDLAVRSEIRHVWCTDPLPVDGPIYPAQKVLDHVNYITDAVCSLSAQPSKMLSGWVSDRINPTYWQQNAEIRVCHQCRLSFDANATLRKHHCRGCGLGFCTACTLHKRPVPGRGWHEPVRVCGSCKEMLFRDPNSVPGIPAATASSVATDNQQGPQSQQAIVRASMAGATGGGGMPYDEQDLMPRKYGEVLMSTLSSVAAVMEYSKDLIKDSARPSYWVPDSESPDCAMCKQTFGTAEELTAAASPNHRTQPGQICDRLRHHCRACGLAVCDSCSAGRMAVPDRGWATEVRVCDGCVQKPRANGGYY